LASWWHNGIVEKFFLLSMGIGALAMFDGGKQGRQDLN